MSKPNDGQTQFSAAFPFTGAEFVKLAMLVADSIADEYNLPHMRAALSGCEFSIHLPSDMEGCVFAVIHSDYFSHLTRDYEHKFRVFSTDVYIIGSATAGNEYRITFFAHPALDDVVDSETLSTVHRTTWAGSDEGVETAATRFIKFTSNPVAARTQLLRAFTSAWVVFSGGEADENSFLHADDVPPEIAGGQELIDSLVALGVAGLGVNVPVLDCSIQKFMAFIISEPFMGVLFTDVRNAARVRDMSGEQIGNVVFLHAVTV